MLLNLDFPFRDLDDLEIKGAPTLAKMLAGVLSQRTDGIEAVKAMCIAIPLHREGRATLDKADADSLSAFVSKTDTLTNLAKHQILEAIEKARNEKKA